MAINRYVNIDYNQPMSNYVPLPLEQLSRIGATMQKNYDEGVDDAYRLNDLMTSVNAIDEHKPYKKILENKYYPKIEELTNKIVNKGDLNTRREINNLKRQWLNDPLRQELESSYAAYNSDLKDINELKQKGLYTDVYNPFKNFKGSLDDGNINPYRSQGARPVQDYLKVGSDLMKGIAKSGNNGKSYKIDSDGNIIGLESGWEAVLDNDVKRVAQNSLLPFLKSKEGQFYIDEMKDRNPNATADDIDNSAFNYLSGLGNKQIFKNIKSGKTFDYAPKYVYDQGKGKEDFISSLIGQTIEGQTYNAIDNNQEFKSLKDQGIFKTDSNGNLKIDWEEVAKPTPVYSTYNYDKGSYSVQTGKTKSLDKEKQLVNQMKKMADVVGFKGKLDHTSFDKIASAYNTLSKARVFGEQLSPPISNLESDKITRNWDLSTAYNPDDINKLAEKPQLREGDKIVITDRQTNSKGEMVKKGTIVNKDGTRTPIAIKSNSLEDTGFFDKIGSIGITGAKYQVGDHKPLGKTNDNKDFIHGEDIPYVGYVAAVADPNNKSNIEYRVVGTDGERHLFSNYSDLQRFLEMEYYTKTPEGKSDTQELINKKKQFETNFEE